MPFHFHQNVSQNILFQDLFIISVACKADLTIYFTERFTDEPVKTLSSDDFRGYQVQIMFKSQDCGFSFITSTFGAYYQVIN